MAFGLNDVCGAPILSLDVDAAGLGKSDWYKIHLVGWVVGHLTSVV